MAGRYLHLEHSGYQGPKNSNYQFHNANRLEKAIKKKTSESVGTNDELKPAGNMVLRQWGLTEVIEQLYYYKLL